MTDNDKKALKPMPPEFVEVAEASMAFRVAMAEADSARRDLSNAIFDATPLMIGEGLNVFNRGPAMSALRRAGNEADAELVHFELDRLRRLMGYEKPPQTRGPGGGR